MAHDKVFGICENKCKVELPIIRTENGWHFVGSTDYAGKAGEMSSEINHVASADKANKADKADYATSAGTAGAANRMSSLTSATINVSRPIWFSDNATPTIPRKDDDFKYNPSTNTLKVKNIDTNSTVKRLTTPLVMLEYGKLLSLGELPEGKDLEDIMLVTIGAAANQYYGQWGVVGYGVNADPEDPTSFRFGVDYTYAHLMFSAEIGHGDGSMWMTIGQDGAPVRGWRFSSDGKVTLLEFSEGELLSQKVYVNVYFK